jgi:hypothetical protein
MILSLNHTFKEILRDKDLNVMRIIQVPEKRSEIEGMGRYYASEHEDLDVHAFGVNYVRDNIKLDKMYLLFAQVMPDELKEYMEDADTYICLKPNDFFLEAKTDKIHYICKVTPENVDEIVHLIKNTKNHE